MSGRPNPDSRAQMMLDYLHAADTATLPVIAHGMGIRHDQAAKTLNSLLRTGKVRVCGTASSEANRGRRRIKIWRAT